MSISVKWNQSIEGDHALITTQVVGVTFEGRQTVVAKLQPGERLCLRREPTNPHDPNAVQVVRLNGEVVGYLSKFLAARLARDLDSVGGETSASTVNVVGAARPESNLGVTIRFEEPGAKRASVEERQTSPSIENHTEVAERAQSTFRDPLEDFPRLLDERRRNPGNLEVSGRLGWLYRILVHRSSLLSGQPGYPSSILLDWESLHKGIRLLEPLLETAQGEDAARSLIELYLLVGRHYEARRIAYERFRNAEAESKLGFAWLFLVAMREQGMYSQALQFLENELPSEFRLVDEKVKNLGPDQLMSQARMMALLLNRSSGPAFPSRGVTSFDIVEIGLSVMAMRFMEDQSELRLSYEPPLDTVSCFNVAVELMGYALPRLSLPILLLSICLDGAYEEYRRSLLFATNVQRLGLADQAKASFRNLMGLAAGDVAFQECLVVALAKCGQLEDLGRLLSVCRSNGLSSPVLRFHEAFLAEHSGDFDTASVIYRELAEKNLLNPVAGISNARLNAEQRVSNAARAWGPVYGQ